MPVSLEKTVAGFVMVNNRYRTSADLNNQIDMLLEQRGRIVASFQDFVKREDGTAESYNVAYLVRVNTASAALLEQLKKHPAVGHVYTRPINPIILNRMCHLLFPHKNAIITAMETWNKYFERYAASQSL